MGETTDKKEEGNRTFIQKLNLIVSIALAVMSLISVAYVYFSGKTTTVKEPQQVETPAEGQPIEESQEPQDQQSQNNKQINL